MTERDNAEMVKLEQRLKLADEVIRFARAILDRCPTTEEGRRAKMVEAGETNPALAHTFFDAYYRGTIETLREELARIPVAAPPRAPAHVEHAAAHDLAPDGSERT